MNLRVYLATKNMSVKEFSRSLDVEPSYISSIMHERNYAGRKLRRRILEKTNGEVELPEKKIKEEPQQQQNS